jgi:hypothetical protein
VVLISLEFVFITSHIWHILSVVNRDLSEYHSNNLHFHASVCHLSWFEFPRAYCRMFVYFTIDTMTLVD